MSLRCFKEIQDEQVVGFIRSCGWLATGAIGLLLAASRLCFGYTLLSCHAGIG
jgi:hypothetical protein